MLDFNAPLELDDGTPIIRANVHGSTVTAHFLSKKNPVRPGMKDGVYNFPNSCWSYSSKTGVFEGGSAEKMFVLRNVGPREPEDYEAFFV